MGRVMGEEVLRVMGATQRTSSEVRIWAGRKTLRCPGRDRTNSGREGAPGTYVDGEPVNIRVGLMTIGTTAFAMVNAELYNCRVRDWRDICVERDSFPAPPHKNCS